MTSASVLVTGCSAGGIGAALCHEFQRRGLHVFATARTPSKLGDLPKLPNVTTIALDVTSASSIADAVKLVEAKTGRRLDYLVNNSGAQYVMPTLDMDLGEAKRMYDVNVWGVIAMIQAFAPLLILAKGSIVNIASIAGYLYAPWMGVYGGSKAAIDLISETLRLELAPFDVKVVTCVTGAVKTNLMSNATKHDLPPASIYTPVANKVSERANGEDVKDTSTPEDFAKRLVNDTLSGASGKVYRGKLATITRFVSTFLPTGILVNLLPQRVILVARLMLDFQDDLLTKGTGLTELPGSSKA
ncbi:MAG: hypothetical protein Q9201_006008 [Fulgogasparrea decipioides]